MDEQTLNYIKQMVMRGMLLADQSRAVAHERALPRGEYREVPQSYDPDVKHAAVVEHLRSKYRLRDDEAGAMAARIMSDPNEREWRREALAALPRTRFEYQPTIHESAERWANTPTFDEGAVVNPHQWLGADGKPVGPEYEHELRARNPGLASEETHAANPRAPLTADQKVAKRLGITTQQLSDLYHLDRGRNPLPSSQPLVYGADRTK